jgi:predicted PurR-regulated permease PerM
MASSFIEGEKAMSTTKKFKADEQFIANSLGSFLRIGVLLLIVYYSLQILGPFVNLTLWAIILAVALYPMHKSLAARLGNREKLSTTIIVVVGLFVLLFPVSVMTESGIESAKSLSSQLQAGELSIPPPSDRVASWPLIGEKVHTAWSAAAANLEQAINQFKPQLTKTGEWLLRAIGGVAGGILAFAVSIIVAGFFLVSAEACYEVSRKIMTQLLGEPGNMLTDMSISTIRSVAKGVLGVAIIQTILAAIGLVLMDVPYTGIIAAIILLIAVMQLPPLIVIGPLIVWVYSFADPVGATIFAVYMLFVSISDTFFKPLLLGRGVQIPTLVILLGAIGGAIYAGVIGLFIGAVILALAYELVLFWMDPGMAEKGPEAATEEQ